MLSWQRVAAKNNEDALAVVINTRCGAATPLYRHVLPGTPWATRCLSSHHAAAAAAAATIVASLVLRRQNRLVRTSMHNLGRASSAVPDTTLLWRRQGAPGWLEARGRVHAGAAPGWRQPLRSIVLR